MKLLFSMFLLLLLLSCSKGGDDRLAQQADIQAQEDIQAQNDNQRQWAEKMEKDLNKRKYFLNALEGDFSGEIEVEGILFHLSAKFLPSLPIEFPMRTRTLDEINFELQNLSLNLHLKLENPRVSNSGVSCTIENYRPDITAGTVSIISESCKNIFRIAITDEYNLDANTERESRAKKIATEIVNNELNRIDMLDGFFESSISSKQFRFFLKRQL